MNLTKIIFRLVTQNSKLIIAFISGVLMGLTVAPVGAWFLAWLALAPLWILIVDKAKHSPSPRIPLLSLAWATGYHGVAISWITGLHPLTWLGVPWLGSLGITFFAWSFITLWGGFLVTVWSISFYQICRQVKISPLLRVLIGTALWCLFEKIWSAGPLWWTGLAYTQSPHNLLILHLGQISGPHTITAVIIVVNGLIAEGWLKNQKNQTNIGDFTPSWLFNSYSQIAVLLLIISHLIGFSLYSYTTAELPEKALKIGVIQGNIPNRVKFDYIGLRRAIEGYTAGYKDLVAQGVDAVLTPEGALPFFSSDIKNSSLVAAVKEKGVVAWIGGFAEKGGGDYTNSLLTFTGDGKIFSQYDKAKLVPLGEYIPFENILGGLIRRLSPVTARQIPGNPQQIFETPFGRAIVGYCYESAFAEIFRHQAASGGEFILTASNNDPYSFAMKSQHHAQDIMRAIETDRWAARATNTGLSAFVDPHGKTLWISGNNTYEIHAKTIYRRQTQTFYVRYGDWLTALLLSLSIILFCFTVFLASNKC